MCMWDNDDMAVNSQSHWRFYFGRLLQTAWHNGYEKARDRVLLTFAALAGIVFAAYRSGAVSFQWRSIQWEPATWGLLAFLGPLVIYHYLRAQWEIHKEQFKQNEDLIEAQTQVHAKIYFLEPRLTYVGLGQAVPIGSGVKAFCLVFKNANESTPNIAARVSAALSYFTGASHASIKSNGAWDKDDDGGDVAFHTRELHSLDIPFGECRKLIYLIQNGDSFYTPDDG